MLGSNHSTPHHSRKLGSRLTSMAKAPHLSVTWFHAHVYFDEATASVAQQFQQRMKQEWSSKQVQVHDLHHKPIGPHPLPMFEAGFGREAYTDFVTWLQFERPEELPVLIHCYTEQMVMDHTRRALWLGQKPSGPHGGIKLDLLERFEAYNASKA